MLCCCCLLLLIFPAAALPLTAPRLQNTGRWGAPEACNCPLLLFWHSTQPAHCIQAHAAMTCTCALHGNWQHLPVGLLAFVGQQQQQHPVMHWLCQAEPCCAGVSPVGCAMLSHAVLCCAPADGLPELTQPCAEPRCLARPCCGSGVLRVGQQQGPCERGRHGAVYQYDAAAVRAPDILRQLLPTGKLSVRLSAASKQLGQHPRKASREAATQA